MKNTPGSTQLPPLIGMTLPQLQGVARAGGMPAFVGRQIADWLYSKKVTSFDEMINISKTNRQWLADNYTVGRAAPVKRSKSVDGTVKYLFDVGCGNSIESVYIPDKDRATLCVSSQAGCKMNCYFCATGRHGFKADLTPAQIINQILSVPPAPAPGARKETELTNVVFMGMGEPLDNLKAVLPVIDILTAPWGLAWSPKRITVSTVGKLPELKELLDRTQVHVAVSVHTPDPAEREAMMPAQKAFPIANVMKVLEGYDFTRQRRLSLEYIMWRRQRRHRPCRPAHPSHRPQWRQGQPHKVSLNTRSRAPHCKRRAHGDVSQLSQFQRRQGYDTHFAWRGYHGGVRHACRKKRSR